MLSQRPTLPEYDLPIEIRPPIPADEAYLFRTHLDSIRVTGVAFKNHRDKIFYKYAHKVLSAILARGAKVLVASAPGDTSVIYGVLIYEPTPIPEEDKEGVLHWAYVKSTYRRLKVATRLIEASGIDPNKAYYTFSTNSELAVNVRREAARRGVASDWKSLRDLKSTLVAEREAKDQMEGDSRCLLRKWPGLDYCLYRMASW